MSPAPDSTLDDPQKIIADLRRELDERAAAFRAHEERYALVGQAVAEGVYDWDIENNTLWMSPRLIEIFGLTGTSLRAEDWNDKVHPGDFEHYRAALRACFKELTPRLHCEYRIRLSTGEYRWVGDNGLPVQSPSGRVVRLVGAVSDITERKQAAQALEATNRVKDGLLRDLSAVSEAIDYGVLFMGPDLRARVVNRAFRQMWGIPDTFIASGPTMADLIQYNRHNSIYDVPEAEFDDFVANRVKAIQAGNIAPVEMHRADGIILRYEGIVLPDGGRLLTYFDITETKRREAELKETLEQQIAAAEVLQVINSSPGDLAPVFDAMLEKALDLCDAAFGSLLRFDGSFFHRAATRNFPAALANLNQPIPPFPGSALERVAQGEPFAHIEDITADQVFRSGNRGRLAMAEAGARTAIWVALRKDDALLGTFVAYRQEVRSFTDKQIALLQSFSAQAVIAMENARLITETREALERQTATAEVLWVINASPGDLAPVFDAMLEKASRLCGTALGVFDSYDGEVFRTIALRGAPPALAEFYREPRRPMPGSFTDQIVQGASIVSADDLAEDAIYGRGRGTRAAVDLGGGRSFVGVALRKDEKLLGVFWMYRQEVRPFSEREIALLQNFAAQAVIAMENARLIIETREARDDAEVALRDLRAAQTNLIQAEKMASLGQVTAGIAHEIKNPLNFVNNFASLSNELLRELKEQAEPALATLDGSKRAEIDETLSMLSGNLEKIAEHGKRADNIVKSMLEHSRGMSGERREVDLNNLVDEALNLAYHGARAQDASFSITLERDFAPALAPIELAPQEMTRVFLNLIGNGFYATTKRAREAGNGSFRPILAVTTRDLGDEVEIKVRDNGTGISPEIKDKLFQPFFTTKPTGEGTGLGLSISYDIVTQQHGGTIAVASQVGEFTEFTVRLPRH